MSAKRRGAARTILAVAVAAACAGLASAAAASAAGVALARPGLITSVGQSADLAIVKVLLNTQLQLGLEVKPLARPADLTGVKTLVVVVGASAKGLGAAGVDIDGEIARARALMKAAKGQGTQVLVMHTGGESRRGKTSNDLIDVVVPEATYVVVVAAGNKDQYLTTLAGRTNTPVSEVANLAAAREVVRELFK